MNAAAEQLTLKGRVITPALLPVLDFLAESSSEGEPVEQAFELLHLYYVILHDQINDALIPLSAELLNGMYNYQMLLKLMYQAQSNGGYKPAKGGVNADK